MPADASAARPFSARRTLWASCGGTLLVTFDGSAVQMVTPALRRALHTDIQSAEWTMTAYLLVTTAAYLPAGRLGDDYGRSRVWGVGLVLFVVASLACMLAPSLPFLIAARVVQALGAAAITASSAPLLLAAFPVEKRARALALGSVAIGLGLLLGPAAGALLTGAVSWRLLFAVAVPLGIGVGAIADRALPHDGAHRPRAIDVGGAFSSMAGLGALVVGASLGHRWGWSAPPTWGLIVAGLMLLGLFVARELHSDAPLLQLRLFARRSFSVGAASALLAYAALFTATATMPFFLIDVQQRGLIESGLVVAVVPIALAIAAPPSGWIADRVGARWVCAAGLCAVTVGLWCGARLSSETGTIATIAALALVGAGLGAYESPNSAASLSALGDADFGVGAATLGVARNLGMTIGAAVAGSLLGGGSARAATAAAHHVLALGAVAAAAAAACTLLRPPGRLAARVRLQATPHARAPCD